MTENEAWERAISYDTLYEIAVSVEETDTGYVAVYEDTHDPTRFTYKYLSHDYVETF